MHVDKLVFSQEDAAKLLQRYKTHRHYQSPFDAEVERVAKLIAAGKMVIRGAGSIVGAGLNDAKLPKLAIARADADFCRFLPQRNGAGTMLSGLDWAHGNTSRSRLFRFAENSFPGVDTRNNVKAIMPHIPPDVRPKRGIENYHVIWEAEWKMEPPVDPILCRRIGKDDFFIVLAQWDLTPIERMVMQSRMGTQ